MTLEELKKFDDEVFECFEQYLPKMMYCEFRKLYPVTWQLVIKFDSSVNFIKTGIFDCAETENIYSIKILIRSLVEHYLRFKYIFFKWGRHRTDDASEKYLIFSSASDELNNVKALIAETQLYNPTFKFTKWNEIHNKYSKADIEKEATLYTYKNIIKFLISEMKGGSDQEIPFLNSVINEYAKLSAYVHGSTHAHNEMLKLGNEDLRIKEILRLTSLATQMSLTIKLFTLMMLIQVDKALFSESYTTLDKISRKYKRAN